MHFYLAIPNLPVTDATLQTVQQLVQKADTQPWIKRNLEKVMLDWPTICTHDIGHTNLIKHRIITTDEIPVRKRAYKVSRDKQQFIGTEIKELLAKEIIRPSISPWASPVVIVPKKDVDQDSVLTIKD